MLSPKQALTFAFEAGMLLISVGAVLGGEVSAFKSFLRAGGQERITQALSENVTKTVAQNATQTDPQLPAKNITHLSILWPNCTGLNKYGNGRCNPRFNTKECNFDGGDCYVPGLPDCHVDRPEFVGDGNCIPFSDYNKSTCGFDGGDCSFCNNCSFAVNAAKWENHGPANYDYEFSHQGFNRNMSVAVRGRKVTANFTDDGSAVTEDTSFLPLELLRITIMFVELGKADALPANAVEVSYDATYGFPNSMFFKKDSVTSLVINFINRGNDLFHP